FWLSKRDVLEFINTAGMTARKLGINKERLLSLNLEEIKSIILQNPTLIKRPIIVSNDKVLIAKEYQNL
ncbi:ArsC family transcriptional regulator, partial [Campylobacter volucris]|uniref:ArsC/Spx/MgsR family protein n=1 Tax=Campylobacter volucris TaxID=1031542 RepID=UPI002B4C0F9C